ncbi:hypothetical protein CSV63_02780 [Sporosarcina sp. P34]|uniref:hypothetical protein n=1 Tax=Sporosarcina sp. P34 TaxID=2048247 RepID=UPI000C1647A7|nr:hypothetical protein [Sporosarcina sp. P34]PID16829.1 hypothetical protein CSV63_02780 [Sporosarcina sp. P34]
MNEVLEALKQRIIYEAEHQGDTKGLAELVNSYTNLVKVAAGTATFDKKEFNKVFMDHWSDDWDKSEVSILHDIANSAGAAVLSVLEHLHEPENQDHQQQ